MLRSKHTVHMDSPLPVLAYLKVTSDERLDMGLKHHADGLKIVGNNS